ncbi:hypothetical protein THAOC_15726 [Thalassiosira oceanica]|uniref:Uncharacterized protein n=1 Tax=Thalassiosira oceanica TaxID=159749 RepID=K0SF26_THAOC|nr:hypothetical protein THAOC_15726 [Thalassiosira oceanica]|eukprot:EJK63604.1 hypothetical protein THAOC_15726 [Thalassiosira oceanica]
MVEGAILIYVSIRMLDEPSEDNFDSWIKRYRVPNIPDGVGDIAPEDLGRESYGSLGLSLPGGLPLQKRRPGLPLGPVTAAIAAGTGRDRARARPKAATARARFGDLGPAQHQQIIESQQVKVEHEDPPDEREEEWVYPTEQAEAKFRAKEGRPRSVGSLFSISTA